MGIEVTLVRDLPVGGEGFVTRLALCDQDGELRLRPAHIVHGAPGGDAQVPVCRTDQGYVAWLPLAFEARGEPHPGEELIAVESGEPRHLPSAVIRFWRNNDLMPASW